MVPASRSSSSSVDDERRRLDAAILLLVSQRNILAPISRLPPEILCYIFSWVQIPYRLENTLLITSVCRHWRHVALADPTLWSVVELNQLDMALDFLERSRGSKIETSLVCGLAAEDGFDLSFIVGILFSSLLRTGSLRLSCTQQVIDKHASLLQSSRGPHLDKFHFRGEQGLVQLPEGLFSGYHPNLLHVSLWSAVVPWDSPILSCLRSLDLTRIHEAGQLTMTELLYILSQCPMLERLSLVKAGPKFTLGEREADVPDLNLPCLTQFRMAHSSIGMHRSAARILLSHLSLPEDISIELQCFSAVSIDMMTLLPSHLQRWAVKSTMKAKFSSSPWDSDYEFVMSGPSVGFGAPHPEENRASYLKVSISQNVREPHEVLQNFLAFLRTTSSSTFISLDLNFEGFLNDVNLVFWRNLFQLVPKLRALTLKGKDTHNASLEKSMLEALVELQPAQPRASDGRNDLEHADIFMNIMRLQVHGANVIQPAVHGLLREFLFFRSLIGNPLEEFAVSASEMFSHVELDHLKELVKTVKFNVDTERTLDTDLAKISRKRRRAACAAVFAVHDHFF